ncbi:MAG: hypothetical protein NTZ53_07705 [Cyanobacteria bacterium]|nr:hypothetical protein [Cyanobacteriota bacterium]
MITNSSSSNLPAPASLPLASGSSLRQQRGPFFVGWVYGPWAAAGLITLLALRLLLDVDGVNQGHGWGLLGSAAICFSIGCVCKTSWALAQRRR